MEYETLKKNLYKIAYLILVDRVQSTSKNIFKFSFSKIFRVD